MENLPNYILVIFILTTALSLFWFYKASNHSKRSLIFVSCWLILQGIVAYNGFYTITNTLPLRFMLLVLPPLLTIVAVFATKKGRQFVDQCDLESLTLFQAVRFPVELVLYWLALQQMVPELMTFEGRNFDVLTGLTAPAVYYFAFVRQKLGKRLLLVWNVAGLVLLFNIVSIAVLSAPTPFQQFAFEQPNKAVFYFPYVWLPCGIVPLALFSHLASIRKLLPHFFMKPSS